MPFAFGPRHGGAALATSRRLPAPGALLLALALLLTGLAPLGAHPRPAADWFALESAPPVFAASAGDNDTASASARRGQVGAESRLKRELREASAEVDAFWQARYDQLGETYTSPRFRTFQTGVRSDCGQLASGIGPFYCALDQTIYVDVPMIKRIPFFRDPFVMRTIFAHEWAHHIQYLSGYEAAVYPDGNGEVFSLQLELHADCLAGVWARSEVDAGQATREDLRNAMVLAYATGDPEGSSLLAPDAHGSSEMRLGAFTMGLDLGRPKPCEREILKLL